MLDQKEEAGKEAGLLPGGPLWAKVKAQNHRSLRLRGGRDSGSLERLLEPHLLQRRDKNSKHPRLLLPLLQGGS